MNWSPASAGPYYADPSLVAFGGRFYLYPTTDGNEGWDSDVFHVLSSDDLASWEDHGEILRLGRDVPWATRNAWAPAAAEKNGLYYFYFTADDNIGVAVASSPTGPFIDSGAPIVPSDAHLGRTIDPAVFTDFDGAAYLIWGNTVAHFARLNDDMLSIDPASVVDWEHPTFREAAHIHRRGDTYYLTWSENDTRDPSYRVRWATSDAPTGPWQERGVLLEQAPERGILATGHHSILRVPGTDDWVIAYHRFAVPDGDGFHRELVIDPLIHLPGGALAPVDPRAEPIRLTRSAIPETLDT
ncbi:family 43 glycosylhydrolase [Microbacterium sp. X-17]|uniref:family 43 glycosylhydrolase n=1 Tax=Microbacterium sp. X-17 TaxID=3144404 RepID=UPI0031F5BB34